MYTNRAQLKEKSVLSAFYESPVMQICSAGCVLCGEEINFCVILFRRNRVARDSLLFRENQDETNNPGGDTTPGEDKTRMRIFVVSSFFFKI